MNVNANRSWLTRTGIYMSRNWQYYILLLPAITWYIIFQYVPMYGIQIAFKNYNPAIGMAQSGWVGLKHFQMFFDGYYFSVLLKNTLTLSLYSLLAGAPLPIITALMLNEIKSPGYKKVIQTIIYAPHFISMVVMVGIIIIMLSPSTGVFNTIIKAFGGEPYYFMADPGAFKHIYVWSGIWQGLGWNTIIYVAALSAVSPELHEAAVIDGASRFQRVIYINVPTLIPTFTILLILSIGSLMSVGYEKALLMQNDLNKTTSQIISTYVYERGLIKSEYSFSSAVGMFNNVINFILLIVGNGLARAVGETSLF